MTPIKAQPVQRQSIRSSPRTVPMTRPGASSTTESVQIDDWQCHYLEDGCNGTGWYTYLMGRLILRIDDLPIASSWLPLLEAARCGDGGQG